MGSHQPPPKPWNQTPCIRSSALSREAGCNIYLKLENLQPSGSFKSRGIGNLLSKAIKTHGLQKPIHFYCSSGGNAGLACATAAINLGRPATIVVPMSTSILMVEKLKTLGADVMQKGLHWRDADRYLREDLLANDKDGVYVPPFDHPDIWEGNGTLIDELEMQMAYDGGYDAVVCSVGGGGLFSGLMEGLERHGRLDGRGRGVRVMAIETQGADSLSYSLKKNQLSRLPAITSIATSLGATEVARKAFEWGQKPEVTSCVFSDAEAAMASVCFADDERILLEAACGVSIATAYNDALSSVLFPDLTESQFAKLNIVLVVCGGSNITLQLLESYKQKYSTDETVVKKFHARRANAQSKEEVVNKIEKEPGVPYIMHDKEQHEQVDEHPNCDERAIKRPAIRAVQKNEIDRQILQHGKVLSLEEERLKQS